MKTIRVLPLLIGLASTAAIACGPYYDDDGSPDPGPRWPWVCPDGAPAPDAGCLPPDAGYARSDADASTD